MASGHVNRANKAEHMAAPHRYLRREDFPCQFGAVHTWPFSEELASDERVRSSKVQRTFSVVALKAGL
jgi:hypothetical protein